MLSLIVTLAAAMPSEPRNPLPSPVEARQAVLACGLPAKRVAVRFEGFMQEDVVWIGTAGGELSEDILTCIARTSLKISYYVYFRNRATQRRYDPLYWAMVEADSLTHAREWLRARNLLATLPLPQAGGALADYAQAVEEFCGVKKSSLLVALNDHAMTFAKEALGRMTANGIEGAAVSDEQFECINNAIAAADLKAHGLFFGFIGNERYGTGTSPAPPTR